MAAIENFITALTSDGKWKQSRMPLHEIHEIAQYDAWSGPCVWMVYNKKKLAPRCDFYNYKLINSSHEACELSFSYLGHLSSILSGYCCMIYWHPLPKILNAYMGAHFLMKRIIIDIRGVSSGGYPTFWDQIRWCLIGKAQYHKAYTLQAYKLWW